MSLSAPIVTGPTACGKTAFALEFAQTYPEKKIEIINADSLLFYSDLSIGTAKPTPEEIDSVPHHLINKVPPSGRFTIKDFVSGVEEAIESIASRGKNAMIVGGSSFYIKALRFGLWNVGDNDSAVLEKLEKLDNTELFEKLKSIDLNALKKISQNDRYRLIRALSIWESTGKTPTELENSQNSEADPRFPLYIIERDNSLLLDRIDKRTKQMIELGLIEETRALMKNYPNARVLDSVGYAQTKNYLLEIPPPGRKLKPGIPGLIDEINLATKQLVKSQRTWFKKSQGKTFIFPDQKDELCTTLNSIYS